MTRTASRKKLARIAGPRYLKISWRAKNYVLDKLVSITSHHCKSTTRLQGAPLGPLAL